jgi:hypothetical protein
MHTHACTQIPDTCPFWLSLTPAGHKKGIAWMPTHVFIVSGSSFTLVCIPIYLCWHTFDSECFPQGPLFLSLFINWVYAQMSPVSFSYGNCIHPKILVLICFLQCVLYNWLRPIILQAYYHWRKTLTSRKTSLFLHNFNIKYNSGRVVDTLPQRKILPYS